MTKLQKSGRYCPLNYYYGAEVLSSQKSLVTDTLYVVGGLYGNTQALRTIIEMTQAEQQDVRIVFNGDFNWFNINPTNYCFINDNVLKHDAIQGNVEAELVSLNDNAGCGCSYPEYVDNETVDRSNNIHKLLKTTAQKYPLIQTKLAQLPLYLRYQVGDCIIGVVHGDCESLAGWKFDYVNLKNNENNEWFTEQFIQAKVDIFASSHTCLPAMKLLKQNESDYCIINNGSAGMPNFEQTRYGIITRVSTIPTPLPELYGHKIKNTYINALPVYFNTVKWLEEFRFNWPKGSAADISYFQRITNGTEHGIKNSVLRGLY